jgi:16S rRNA (guanine(966)-N(2))-methyltransferase RsmD
MKTRAMPDRVKAALFSMLGAHFELPGFLPPIRVADVFSGSGSMGLEALSRGAAYCCFFERDTEALAALRENLADLHVGPEAKIVSHDAWRSAAKLPDGGPFHLIFLDPPYRHSRDPSQLGEVRRFLAKLAAQSENRPLVVLHHPARVQYKLSSDEQWAVVDRRTFGTSGLTTFLR